MNAQDTPIAPTFRKTKTSKPVKAATNDVKAKKVELSAVPDSQDSSLLQALDAAKITADLTKKNQDVIVKGLKDYFGIAKAKD